MLNVMNRWAWIALVGLVAAGGMPTGCTSLGPTHTEERTLEAEMHEGVGIDVQTRNGAITVRRADLDMVRISATLKSPSLERLEATRIIAEHAQDGTLVIRAEWPDGARRNREGCTFEILTPTSYGVKLVSSNGAVTLEGLAGEASLRTSNGALNVTDHDGRLEARTSNGRVTLQRINGNVVARTSNGRIRALSVAGSLDLDTSNGSVEARLSDSSAGPVRIDTSNGSVTLELGARFTGELTLSTRNGSISFDTPASVRKVSSSRNRAVLQVGDGAERSVISTSNGSIRVRFEDD